MLSEERERMECVLRQCRVGGVGETDLDLLLPCGKSLSVFVFLSAEDES